MTKFTLDETAAIVAVQQLASAWAFDLDHNNGLNIGALITDDCEYTIGTGSVKGRAAVEKNYVDRLDRRSAMPASALTTRHLICNLHVRIDGADVASVTFSLAFMGAPGRGEGDQLDIGVLDVRMTCERSTDGDWRIAKFDSNQVFRRQGD